MATVQDLIQQASDEDAASFDSTFADLMRDRISGVIAQAREQYVDQLNGYEDDDVELEGDDTFVDDEDDS